MKSAKFFILMLVLVATLTTGVRAVSLYSEDFESYPLGAQINLSSPAGPGFTGNAATGTQVLVWEPTSIGSGMGLKGSTHYLSTYDTTVYAHAFTNQAAAGIYTLTFDAYAPNNRAAVCGFGLVDAEGDKLYWYVGIVSGQSAWMLVGPSGTVATLPYWDGFDEAVKLKIVVNEFTGKFHGQIVRAAGTVNTSEYALGAFGDASGVFGQWRMDNNGFCWSEMDIDNIEVSFVETNVLYSEDFESYPLGTKINLSSPAGPGFTGNAATGTQVLVWEPTSIGSGMGLKGSTHYLSTYDTTVYAHAFTNQAAAGIYTLTFDAYAPNNRAAVCGFGLVDAEGDKLYWYVGIVSGQSAWTLVGPSGPVATLPYWDGFDEAVELKIVVNEVTGTFHGQIVRAAGTVNTSEYALGAFGDASGIFGQWRMDNAGFCWSEMDIDNVEVIYTKTNLLYSDNFEAYANGTDINVGSPAGPGYSGDATSGAVDVSVMDTTSIGDGKGIKGSEHYWNRATTYIHVFTNQAELGVYTLAFDAYAVNNRAADCSFGLVDAEGDKLYWRVGYIGASYLNHRWELYNGSSIVASFIWGEGIDETVEMKIVVDELTGKFYGEMTYSKGTVATPQYDLIDYDVDNVNSVFGSWRTDSTTSTMYSDMDIDNVSVVFDLTRPVSAQVTASDPAPADGYSAVTSYLVWTAGANAVSHDVYLGTSLAEVNNATAVSLTADIDHNSRVNIDDLVIMTAQWLTDGTADIDGSDDGDVDLKDFATLADKWLDTTVYKGRFGDTIFAIANYVDGGALDYGQTYYWRVDEVNGVDIEKGDVWSFVNERNVIFNSDGEGVFHQADGTELVKLNDWIYDLFRPLEIANVSTLAWFDGANGNTAKYDSSVLEMFGERIGAEDAEIAWEIANSFDPPKVVIEEARDRGIEVWYSFRINDIHDSFTYSNPLDDPAYATFKVNNPSWMIGNDAGWPYAYGAKTALKFDIPGVRAIKLAAVTEMLEKYDFDGIEIDWTRNPTCFSPGTESANKGYLTSLMTDIRNELNALAATRGRPITVAVRVYENMEGCTLNGFDIEAWVDNDLIDIIVPGLGAIDVNVADFAALTAGTDVKIYPSLYTPIYRASVPTGIDRAMATNFLYQGADGIESFNDYAHEVHCYTIPMLGEIADAANLVGLDKVYVADSKSDYPSTWQTFFPHEGLQAPLPLTITSSGDVPVLVGEDIDGVYTPVSVKLMVTSNANSSNITSIAINGHSYSPTIIDVNNVEVLTVNAAHVVSGWNTITITVSGSTVIKAVELYVEY